MGETVTPQPNFSQRITMTPKQMENYIQQLLQGQSQQNQLQIAQNSLINQLQITLDVLNTAVASLTTTSGSGASGGNVFDTYQVGGGILHKLITTFANAVNFSLTILVTGVATFTAAPVLSALAASLPLQLTAGRVITSALINLTSAVTGILPRANGGLGNNAVTAYAGTISAASAAAGTCSTSGAGIAAPGVYLVVAGSVTVPAVGGSIGGTTSSVAVTGTTSTTI